MPTTTSKSVSISMQPTAHSTLKRAARFEYDHSDKHAAYSFSAWVLHKLLYGGCGAVEILSRAKTHSR